MLQLFYVIGFAMRFGVKDDKMGGFLIKKSSENQRFVFSLLYDFYGLKFDFTILGLSFVIEA